MVVETGRRPLGQRAVIMRQVPLYAAFAMLAACGSEPEAAEQPAGAVAVADTGAALSGGFTPYPGAEELSRTSISQNGGSYTLLSLQADAAPEAMVAYYRKQAEDAGIAISLEVSAGGQHQIGGESASGLNFSFTASGAGERTSATLAIGQTAQE